MSILDCTEHSEIITWLPHGRGFIIRDKRRLADEVLPKFFKESKYTSFTRRLNRWNFTIQTHGHKEASYFHPMFIRGDPQRSLEMHPTPQASNKARDARYIADTEKRHKVPFDIDTSPAHGGHAQAHGVGRSMSELEDAAHSHGYPSTMDDSIMARADVSAQVMAAAAGNGDPYDAYQRSMPGLPPQGQGQQQPSYNINGQMQPGQSIAIANPQSIQHQHQYYGQAPVNVNPYAQGQQHHQAMLSRMTMDQAMRQYEAQSGMHQGQNNMVIIHQPPSGMHPAQQHGQQMHSYGGDQHGQYIPTTAASHAHLQARYGDAQQQQQQAVYGGAQMQAQAHSQAQAQQRSNYQQHPQQIQHANPYAAGGANNPGASYMNMPPQHAFGRFQRPTGAPVPGQQSQAHPMDTAGLEAQLQREAAQLMGNLQFDSPKGEAKSTDAKPADQTGIKAEGNPPRSAGEEGHPALDVKKSESANLHDKDSELTESEDDADDDDAPQESKVAHAKTGKIKPLHDEGLAPRPSSSSSRKRKSVVIADSIELQHKHLKIGRKKDVTASAEISSLTTASRD
jgi:hypothetical protein